MTRLTGARQIGFTLIELLAVLVVLSMAAALGVGALGRTTIAHQRVMANATLQEMLERTRQLADGRGGAILELGPRLVARPVDPGAQPDGIIRTLPRGWSARLELTAIATDDAGSIRFAPDGSCGDFEITLSAEEIPPITLRVLGLTGQVIPATYELRGSR
ncbi:MAG: type II secretion system protein [Phycisphaeraceae bacterium]|nr:type II secretion system protein [Phycisphaerales bacterium]MCB9842499.1 type II secretion system protein [Phycisphaeraceae bacterium]